MSEVFTFRQRGNFTIIDNGVIETLGDYVALGLYIEMRSKPEGWKFNIKALARTRKQGRDAISGAMDALIEAGLLVRVRHQIEGGRWARRHVVAECTALTLEEVLQIQQTFGPTAIVETRQEFSTALEEWKREQRPPRPADGHEADADAEQAAKPLVRPRTGFPGLGEPSLGDPSIGRPSVGGTGLFNKTMDVIPPPPSPPRPPTEEEGKGDDDVLGDRADSVAPDTEVDRSAGLHPRTGEVTAALTRSWPMLGRRDLIELEAQISQTLSDDPIGAERLIAHLCSNTAGVRRPADVLRSRLANLPVIPASPPPRVPWCGHCESEDYRWITGAAGARQCPRCHPAMTSRRAG